MTRVTLTSKEGEKYIITALYDKDIPPGYSSIEVNEVAAWAFYNFDYDTNQTGKLAVVTGGEQEIAKFAPRFARQIPYENGSCVLYAHKLCYGVEKTYSATNTNVTSDFPTGAISVYVNDLTSWTGFTETNCKGTQVPIKPGVNEALAHPIKSIRKGK